MNLRELLLGVCLVIASDLTFWIGLPRDGLAHREGLNAAARELHFACCFVRIRIDEQVATAILPLMPCLHCLRRCACGS